MDGSYRLYVRFSIRWEENLLESKKRVNQNYVRKGSEYICTDVTSFQFVQQLCAVRRAFLGGLWLHWNKASMTWCLGFCHCCLTWSTYGLVVKRSKSNSPISLEALKAERESSSPTMFGERRSRLWSSLKSPQRRAPQPKVQRSTSQRGKFNFSRASAFKGHSFCWFVMAFVLRSRLTKKSID